MNYYICPICKTELSQKENSFYCAAGHCFDRSRKGVLNLLRSQSSRHGDDKLMVRARKDFLDRGYYRPLLTVIDRQLRSVATKGCTILDCGCGECWYTANLYESLKKDGIETEFYGIDVSKEAVSVGAGRCKELKLAVATVYDIPLPDHSCDVILSFFAPFSLLEYRRLLKENGCFITAYPLREHLWELKQAVYERPYKNEVSDPEIDGFALISSENVHKTIELCTNKEILSLFSMTPYYYKTSREDKEKLNDLNSLKTQIHFCSAVYQKLS
ncbi:MAG: methyltransferase domain-containing protein [Bacteroides sp.]|nr:methyltransferase domain-containing protein [Eubacterium sp.]MCM1417285.1 methyltransferase domain-containing protein [Roseburia sp.]MCM1461095.1 methyltransferase domain-containing protein [Bacteroides sp.]